jgi:endonuclease YncB( thermonuclease family)
MPCLRLLLLASAVLATATLAHAQSKTIAGRPTVVDGETLQIAGHRIRLAGVAQAADDHVCERTDDERWKCGPRALNALDELLEESIVSCTLKDKDEQGRLVGTCFANGTDIALWLIRGGLAVAAPANSRYVKAEGEARAAKRGMWELPAAQR